MIGVIIPSVIILIMMERTITDMFGTKIVFLRIKVNGGVLIGQLSKNGIITGYLTDFLVKIDKFSIKGRP